jgi:hypothetical protein
MTEHAALWAAMPAIIAAVFAGLMSLLTWWRAGRAISVVEKVGDRLDAVDGKVDQVARQTDGLTKALVKSEKIVSHAEGVSEGVQQEQVRAANGTTKAP